MARPGVFTIMTFSLNFHKLLSLFFIAILAARLDTNLILFDLLLTCLIFEIQIYKCTVIFSSVYAFYFVITVVIRQTRPELKFPTKIEMTFSQTLAIR